MLTVIPLKLTIPYHTKLLSKYTRRLIQLFTQRIKNPTITLISPQNLSLKNEIVFEMDNTCNWFAVKNIIISLLTIILRDFKRINLY